MLSLIFVLCCACQGQSAKKKEKKYELVERDSNNSLTGGKNVSNTSTNTLEAPCRSMTTEESSLEMSDVRSQSTKHSDHDMRITAYPPPPSMYDSPADVYNILPTVNHHQVKPNPLYNIEHSRESALAEELPLPPPPIPAHSVVTVEAEEPEESDCVKGLNPTFKTFLDKTIAIKPMNIYGHRQPHPASGYPRDSNHELKGLITSDL